MTSDWTPRVVFRADGGPSIGAGHVARCLALAAAFNVDSRSVGFAASAETFTTIAALEPVTYDCLMLAGRAEEEPGTMARRWPEGVDVLVVDHYRRGADFERGCRTWAKRIVVFDDIANRVHDADILVSSGATTAQSYRALVPKNCRILVGPCHAMIRPKFLKARPRALALRSARPVERILVSFGLSELGERVKLSLDALAIADYRGAIDVVMPGESLSARCKGAVTFHDGRADMANLMTTADLAIGAAGGTAWERCHLGLPTVFLTDGENQNGIAETIAGAGAGTHAGSVYALTAEQLASAVAGLLADEERRDRMSKAAAELVDGRGAARIFQALLSTVGRVGRNTGMDYEPRGTA